MSTVRDLFKPAGSAPQDRRSELRFPLELPVTLLSARGNEQYVTRDIGFRGVFIVADRCPPPRTLLRLRMILPTTGTELTVHAVVARVIAPNNPAGHEPGMGLELFATDRSTRTLWSGLVCYAHDHADDVDEVDEQLSGVRLSAVALLRR